MQKRVVHRGKRGHSQGWRHMQAEEATPIRKKKSIVNTALELEAGNEFIPARDDPSLVQGVSLLSNNP